MMLQGTNMGIIEGVKLRNQYPDLDKPVQNILNEFVQFQQNNVEQLKISITLKVRRLKDLRTLFLLIIL